jgi:hypothetical protein
MRVHPAAALFPMLIDAELRELAEDIKANGLQSPIVTLQGEILDGRNRLRACEIAGVAPVFREHDGPQDDAVSFVISANLHRRHLGESQRAMVAARLATLKHGQRADRVEPPIGGTTQAEAAARLNVGERSVQRAAKVIEKGTPELVAAVQRGDVAVSAAAVVAELPKTEQEKIVAEGPTAVTERSRRNSTAAPSTTTPTTPATPASPTTAVVVSRTTWKAITRAVAKLEKLHLDGLRARATERASGDPRAQRLARRVVLRNGGAPSLDALADLVAAVAAVEPTAAPSRPVVVQEAASPRAAAPGTPPSEGP